MRRPGRRWCRSAFCPARGEHPTADAELTRGVRAQLRDWFGADADTWKFLRGYAIPRALPRLEPSLPAAMQRTGVVRVADDLLVCGDHLATPSIQGAMLAGSNAARAITEPAGAT